MYTREPESIFGTHFNYSIVIINDTMINIDKMVQNKNVEF